MSESIYVRLVNILGDLEAQVRQVESLAIRMALEQIVQRLDDMVEETIGLKQPEEEA